MALLHDLKMAQKTPFSINKSHCAWNSYEEVPAEVVLLPPKVAPSALTSPAPLNQQMVAGTCIDGEFGQVTVN